MAMAEPIEIVDYNPAWPETFERLREHLLDGLKDGVIAIEHVGSTAVPGLAAKPIIDIDIVIEHLHELPKVGRLLENLGYEHLGDLGIEGRHAFGPPNDLPRHHLYVVSSGSKPHRDHIDLRDHLRASKHDAHRYAEAKKSLAIRFRHDREAYTEAKSGIIQELLKSSRTRP